MSEEQLLKKRNINPTASRIIVLRYFIESSSTVSLKKLEEDLYNSDTSTLYRTLKTFEKQKIIHSVDDGTGIKKYGLCSEKCECSSNDQHFHFHCNNCQETFCLPKQNLPPIHLPSGFSITSANLVLKGVCSNCK